MESSDVPFRTIGDKKEFYRMYLNGAFGNRAFAWGSYDELIKSDWRGKVCIRSLVGMGRGKVKYNIPFGRVREAIASFERRGFSEENLSFNQSMPDQNLVLQGEVMRGMEGFELTYTTVKKPMNVALKEEELYASGLVAKIILQEALWPSSYNDLTELLDLYSNDRGSPSCVVEFSAYDVAVGDCRGRNAVIWEVRNY